MEILYKKEESNLCGIYKISNILNDKIYIGSAIIFRKRKDKHLLELRRNIHHSIILQRFYNKYGENFLKFSIIEICNRDNLIEKEQFWIDKLNPKFNICKIAGYGNRLNIPMSEKSKIKLSISKKGKRMSVKSIEKMRQTKIGSKLSEETKIKISIAMKGKKHSNESKLKMSINHNKNKLKKVTNEL